MKDIGVNEARIYVNYFNKVRPQTDSIGVTMGSKTISGDRTLVVIGIRGANYEQEWASNVTLGLTGEAQGFSKSAEMVYDDLQRYVKTISLDLKPDNKLDFWIAGFSRAGAVANLLAKRLVDDLIPDRKSQNANRVFAYCMEAPRGGVASAEKPERDYDCIHSVINKNDIMPYVAPYVEGFMEFIRYGVDHYEPGSDADYKSANADNEFYDTSNQNYTTLKPQMEIQLKAIQPAMTYKDNFKSRGLNNLYIGRMIFDKEHVLKDGNL